MSSIWAVALSNAPDLPPRAPSMSIPAFVRLLFIPYCHVSILLPSTSRSTADLGGRYAVSQLFSRSFGLGTYVAVLDVSQQCTFSALIPGLAISYDIFRSYSWTKTRQLITSIDSAGTVALNELHEQFPAHVIQPHLYVV